MRIDYAEVSIPGTKSCKCQKCGKRLKRSRKFWQTINPFNKTADGFPKRREDIYPELLKERDEWMKEPELCSACE